MNDGHLSPVLLRKEMDALDPDAAPRARIFRRAHAGISREGASLGVLDASFNPPTMAHKELVQNACEALHLDEAALILSRANVDKEIFGADLGQRLFMLLKWAEAHNHITVGGCSHARFVDKAAALRVLYPADTDIVFILGFDTLERLFDSRYYKDMSAELTSFFLSSRIAVSNRGENDLSSVEAWLKRPECDPFSGRIHPFSISPDAAGMSSTRVRDQYREGVPVQKMVPDGVAELIAELELYK